MERGCPTPSRLLLEVDVGTDQHVIEQEDPALLGLDQLPTVSVHRLRQSLTQKQLPLARGQQLEKEGSEKVNTRVTISDARWGGGATVRFRPVWTM